MWQRRAGDFNLPLFSKPYESAMIEFSAFLTHGILPGKISSSFSNSLMNSCLVLEECPPSKNGENSNQRNSTWCQQTETLSLRTIYWRLTKLQVILKDAGTINTSKSWLTIHKGVSWCGYRSKPKEALPNLRSHSHPLSTLPVCENIRIVTFISGSLCPCITKETCLENGGFPRQIWNS